MVAQTLVDTNRHEIPVIVAELASLVVPAYTCLGGRWNSLFHRRSALPSLRPLCRGPAI